MNGLKGRLERSLLGARRTCKVSCSRWSGLCGLRCSSRHATFLRVVGGRIPERKSVGVDLIQHEIGHMASFNWVSNLRVCALWHQAWEQYFARSYTKALVEVLSTLNEHPQVTPTRRFIKATRDEDCFSVSESGLRKWDFCQEWYPSMSDYSGSVGAFQERILIWIDTLHDGFWCGKLSRQFCWWRALSATWIRILVW